MLLRGRREKDACGTAKHIENKLFAAVDGVAFGFNFELLRVPVLGELTDCFYDLDGG